MVHLKQKPSFPIRVLLMNDLFHDSLIFISFLLTNFKVQLLIIYQYAEWLFQIYAKKIRKSLIQFKRSILPPVFIGGDLNTTWNI